MLHWWAKWVCNPFCPSQWPMKRSKVPLVNITVTVMESFGVNRPLSVADLREARGMPAHWGSKFLQFHAVFDHMLVPPPGQSARPLRGNPWSATVYPYSIGSIWSFIVSNQADTSHNNRRYSDGNHGDSCVLRHVIMWSCDRFTTN